MGKLPIVWETGEAVVSCWLVVASPLRLLVLMGNEKGKLPECREKGWVVGRRGHQPFLAFENLKCIWAFALLDPNGIPRY